jgi:hypothetical protein
VSKSKTAAQIQEDMRSGVAYYGTGMFGNGYYFATVRQIAKDDYSDGSPGSVLRALLPKTAVRKDYVPVASSSHTISSRTSKAKGSYEEGTLYDPGRYAAAIGLDAIEIPYGTPGSSHVAPRRSQPAFNVLNRSILIIEEA